MLRIVEPFHGAVLNRRHGRQTADALHIIVRGEADGGAAVAVNGVPARREGNEFFAEVPVREKEADIVAVASGVAGRQEHGVRVVWDRHSRPRYRFSIDDNSFFLRDIAANNYASLFDNFYLAILRGLNRKYGAKFSVNVFYQTPENDFELHQFPDRYKGEWRDNAGWLKLAFHAWKEFPARPYQWSPPARLAEDFDRVAEQIHRFAGDEAYAPPTVIHWGMVQPDALGVLAARGVRVLSTLLRKTDGRWDVNYLLDDERCEFLMRQDAMKDFESGIYFSNCDIICNDTPVKDVAPTLDRMTNLGCTDEILDLFTHEQYFWKFYCNYRPDHGERLDAAIRWATERGYQPVFFHEGLLGGQDW
jgi:hypothetical protein